MLVSSTALAQVIVSAVYMLFRWSIVEVNTKCTCNVKEKRRYGLSQSVWNSASYEDCALNRTESLVQNIITLSTSVLNCLLLLILKFNLVAASNLLTTRSLHFISLGGGLHLQKDHMCSSSITLVLEVEL